MKDNHALASKGVNALVIRTIDAPLSGRRGYVIDPHDGRCNGQHNIAVTQFYVPEQNRWGRALYTLPPTAVLSREGTKEIFYGIEKALELGAELDGREDVE